MAEDDTLAPWDARVARAIRRDRSRNRRHVLDRAAAVMALVGHPGVVLSHAPTVPMEVTEAAPTLEAVRESWQRRRPLRAPHRPAAAPAPAMEDLLPPAAREEAEALRQITVLQDGPRAGSA